VTVSVVVPTHRRPALLRAALDSVLAQTRAPDEVVVVDDAGDAATAAVVAEAASAAPLPVRLVHLPGGTGASASRNAGARAATGEVLAFLDDDDTWAPTYLAAALRCAQSEGVPVVFTGIQIRLPSGRRRIQRMPPGLTAAVVLVRNPGMTGSSLVLRRAAFERVGGFDETLPVSNDKDLLVRLLDAGLPYGVVTEPLVRRAPHDADRLTRPSRRRAEGLAAFRAKYAGRLTRGQRRYLDYRIERVLLATATSPAQAVRHAARMAALLGPLQLDDLRAALARRLPAAVDSR